MKNKPDWKGSRYSKDGITKEVKRIYSIKVEKPEINEEYKLDTKQETTINNQGLLLVGRLIPRKSSLPSFNIRWDEKAKHLNVDMISRSASINDWESETNGYKGHKPDVLNTSDGLSFFIEVKIPQLDIFKGIINFRISRNTTITIKTAIGLKTLFQRK